MKSDTTRKYWRSFDERNQTAAYKAEVSREFQDELDVSTPEPEGTTRRSFLGWVSASLAASGLVGCDAIRRPVEKILPYSVAPEEILPGIPQYYASATQVGGEVVGVLVESHEGRPTKVEGNPLHRGSLGALSAQHQSQVLDLYDPTRLRATAHAGKALSAAEARALLAEKGASWAGKRVAFLAEAIPSKQLERLRTAAISKFAGAKWFTYESVSDDNQRAAMKAVFGEALRPVYGFSTAKTILSLDADFLAGEGPAVAAARQWSDTRRVGANKSAEISRLYAVEANFSLTGSNADHRVRASYAQIEAFALAVASQLGVSAPAASVQLDERQVKAAAAVAADLKASGAGALVLAGRAQPPVVHALAAAMNAALGASVKYYPDVRRAPDALGDMEGAKALSAALSAGEVDALVIIGGNPAYAFPADAKFADAVKKAGEVVYLTDMANETTQALSALDAAKAVIVPRAHYLESWGDLVHIDGQIALQQPLIQPLHAALSDLELLAALLGDKDAKGYDIVRGAWKEATGAVGFHKRWRRWLHEGVVEDAFAAFAPVTKAPNGLGGLGASVGTLPTSDKLDALFVPSHNLFDGRFANNSWQQEVPDPLTKITWDNAALLSPATAEKLGVTDEDMVTVSLNGASVKMAVWRLPGLADNTVVLTLGYGREFKNYLPYHEGSYNASTVAGFDVTPLRASGAAFAVGGATLSKSGETYVIAAVQRHDNSRQHSIEGFENMERPKIVRETTVAGYAENPTFAKPGIIKHGEPMPDKTKFAVLHPEAKSIYGDFDYSTGLQWGMVIDLSTCTGCNACMVACVAENNIPMVGKDQVRRGREMHWIRMDRYFTGSDDNPEVVHQPLSCQQCETAPCENVCPVAATVHSPEGLNDMVYNRCIGTRYCANNCPLKVRRFNFYNYAKGQDELVHMQRNPNVTVRFRGVMEKCTYCVQRINKGKRNAALNPEVSQQIIDRITPACAQGCPTKAITFGDINNPKSEVAQLKAAALDYVLLSELNLQSRTSFLAKVRNPNPSFPG
jgi:MoCo/4Fe-4S cofactor protein with predicted Tat translocation signal